MNSTGKVDRTKDKLNRFVKEQVTDMFTAILDFTEVAVGDKERHRALRAKILRLSNDAIRTIKKEIDDNYKVEFVAPLKDIIVVKKNNK